LSGRLAGSVAEPEAGAGTVRGRRVAGVKDMATLQRETPTADAVVEAAPQPLEFRDARVHALRPQAGEPCPLRRARRAVRRERRERASDLLEREPHALGEHDERDAPDHPAPIAPVPRRGPLREQEPALLIEAQGRRRDPAARREFADGEQRWLAA